MTVGAERIAAPTPWRTSARIGAVVLPFATCAILSTLRDTITAATAVLVLVLWVVAAAASGDRLAGMLAAVSGGAWFDFFLTEPYQHFTIADPDDIEATALLVRTGPGVIGHFLVTATTEVTYPSKERRQVAVLLADQVAAALDVS